MNHASITNRALAMLIDATILAVIGLIAFGQSYSITGPGLDSSIPALIAAWLYFALQDSSASQATLGKKVMGLKVVNANGEAIDFKTASIRYLGKLASSFILLLGYALAFFDAERKTLHDRIADTLVVNR